MEREGASLLDCIIETVNVLNTKLPQAIEVVKDAKPTDANYGELINNLDKTLEYVIKYRNIASGAIEEINKKLASNANAEKESKDTKVEE